MKNLISTIEQLKSKFENLNTKFGKQIKWSIKF